MGGSFALISISALSMPQPAQGGKQVLHGVDLHAALAQRGRALDLLDVVDVRRDRRLVGQVDALENEAGVRRRGLDRQGDFGTGVQGEALDRLRLAHGGLFETGHWEM